MDGRATQRPLRVAIACPGVGLVQRGYERMFRDLFDLMQGEVDATLFKGGGATGEREKIPVFLPRNGLVVRALPVHRLVGRAPMHTEGLTFGLGLLPHLRGGRFDIVHCIDPPVARTLYAARRKLGLGFRLLFTHGCSMPPEIYPPADHIQETAKVTRDEAIAAGIPAAGLTLLPPGFHPARFETPLTREAIRRKHGVSNETFVILSIAALNRSHKRTHYLVDEAARLEGDVLLWLDGSLDHGDPGLVDYARARLGDRCKVTHVPSSEVGELHRMADVMAHAALFEAFGLSIVEAAAMGLPVIVHDAPHFRWLLPNPLAWTDMSRPGALAARLAFLREHREALAEVRCAGPTRARFAWDNLREGYRDLYEHVASLPMLVPRQPGKAYFRKLHE